MNEQRKKEEKNLSMAQELKLRGWKSVAQFSEYINVTERTLRNWKQHYPVRYKAILKIPVPLEPGVF